MKRYDWMPDYEIALPDDVDPAEVLDRLADAVLDVVLDFGGQVGGASGLLVEVPRGEEEN